MNEKEFHERVKYLKEQKVPCGVFDFKGQKPIEFLKIEVFEVSINKDAFHWDTKGKIIDWKKDFIFLLGEMCGIESGPFHSEKMGKYSYLSKANLFRILPSGNKEYASAEYEFDAEIRAEEAILKDEVYNQNPDKRKYRNDAQKRLAVVEQAKFGRQRADTGAHKRAIIKMLNVPKAKDDLIGCVLFCFKCTPNFENSAIRNMYLTGGNPASSVFGDVPQITKVEDDDTIQGEPSAAFTIAEKREGLKKNPVLYKLSGIVLDKDEHTEEFLQFLKNYKDIQNKEVELMKWVRMLEEVGPIKTGEEKKFLEEWGNN